MFLKKTVRLIVILFWAGFFWQANCFSAYLPVMSDSQKLQIFLDDFFDELQEHSPEFATYIGKTKDYNGRWSDHSEAGYSLRYQLTQNRLCSLLEIKRELLSIEEQLNYDLLERDLKERLEEHRFQTHYMPIDPLGGIPLNVVHTLMMMPKDNLEDYEAILLRLSAIPLLMDQTIELLKKGLERGVMPPQIVLKNVPESLAKMVPSSIENSVFFQLFAHFPECISQEQQNRVTQKVFELVSQQVYPAYIKLKSYLENEYLPASRQTIAAGDLPNGKEWYGFSVKKHTTTHLTPIEIHKIGLNEVTRIEGEMQKILDAIEFSGSISDYFTYLNTSSEFFFTDPEKLIENYRVVTQRIVGQLPLLFGRLPKLPFEVVPIPSYAEEGQISAYYMCGSLATGRPGYFYVNTYHLESRPKWEIENLSLHEAVPGHHLQISIAQEIEGLPEFRKHNHYTAYIEGWGLYSEGLGKELGLYNTPPDQFGRLIAEMWRSVRLVVDTGMHALGWTREMAIAYMKEKTGLAEREVIIEIDRYIVWPGQALAYKIGELSIKKWRHKAEEILGAAFDIRDFHDILLGQGALPLDVCETYIDQWISEKVPSSYMRLE